MNTRKDQQQFHVALGKWLAGIRIEKGVSQESLSTQLEKGQSDIAKIEGGQKKVTVHELVCWLNTLDVPPEKVVEIFNTMSKKTTNKKSLWNSVKK